MAAGGGSSTSGGLRIFALGDTGRANLSVRHCLFAMERRALSHGKPNFILLLGDNIYPRGVQDNNGVESEEFQEKFVNLFLSEDTPSLHVPYFVVLGNHDYMNCADFRSQIRFTWAAANPDGLWRMPARNYAFRASLSTGQIDGQRGVWQTGAEPNDDRGTAKPNERLVDDEARRVGTPGVAVPDDDAVDFFAFDTNGVQFAVRRSYPALEQMLHRDTRALNDALQASKAKTKVVFGHHPLFTRGSEHGVLGRVLQDEYGLGDVYERGGVSLVLNGHEHVLQATRSRGSNHLVAGATGGGTLHFYGGLGDISATDWAAPEGTLGFLEITFDPESGISRVSAISESGVVLYETVGGFGEDGLDEERAALHAKYNPEPESVPSGLPPSAPPPPPP